MVDDRKKIRKDILDEICAQIARSKKTIERLYEHLNIDELTAVETLTMIHRFEAQQQRALEIKQACMMDEPEKCSAFIVGLVNDMRQPSPKLPSLESKEEEDSNGAHN